MREDCEIDHFLAKFDFSTISKNDKILRIFFRLFSSTLGRMGPIFGFVTHCSTIRYAYVKIGAHGCAQLTHPLSGNFGKN